MRDIEFRGKWMVDGEWAYGFYDYMPLTKRHIIHFYKDSDSAISCRVIPETVGEYTGLKDKNSVKIFEGDILLVNTARGSEPHYKKMVVEWKTPYFSGFVFDKGEYKPQFHEVIGNIHDNPELLHAN